MTAVHELLKQYIIDSGLITGYKMQMYQWVDTGVSGDKFVVIMPDGGLPTKPKLSNEYNVILMLVGDKNQTKPIADNASEILDYIKDNPGYGCIHYMYNNGGFPKPLFTEDNRIVLQISVTIISN